MYWPKLKIVISDNIFVAGFDLADDDGDDDDPDAASDPINQIDLQVSD